MQILYKNDSGLLKLLLQNSQTHVSQRIVPRGMFVPIEYMSEKNRHDAFAEKRLHSKLIVPPPKRS